MAENSEGNFAVDGLFTVSYDGKFHPGQTVDLYEEGFKVSMVVRSGKYWKRPE